SSGQRKNNSASNDVTTSSDSYRQNVAPKKSNIRIFLSSVILRACDFLGVHRCRFPKTMPLQRGLMFFACPLRCPIYARQVRVEWNQVPAGTHENSPAWSGSGMPG